MTTPEGLNFVYILLMSFFFFFFPGEMVHSNENNIKYKIVYGVKRTKVKNCVGVHNTSSIGLKLAYNSRMMVHALQICKIEK